MSKKVSDPYTYPNSDVLKNKLNIKDYNKLCAAEREFAEFRGLEMEVKTLKGNLDATHLFNIHKYLFQDIYTWAGKTRNVNIAKGDAFCQAQFIEEQLNSTMNFIKKNSLFVSKDREEAFSLIIDVLGDINAIHPFREGNGRTERTFIDCLFKINGFCINFNKFGKEDNLIASQQSLWGNNKPLLAMYKNAVVGEFTAQERMKFVNDIIKDKNLAKELCEQIKNKALCVSSVKDKLQGMKEHR